MARLSISASELHRRLTAAGLGPKDIKKMSYHEKQVFCEAIVQSSLETVTPDSALHSDKQSDQAFTETQDSADCPSRPVIVNTAMMRHIATDSEIALQLGFANVQAVHQHWADAVAPLATFDELEINRYRSKIRKAAERVVDAPSEDPIRIAVVLPNGHRIDHHFDHSTQGGDLYLWCAADRSMIDTGIRPGHFAIRRRDGSLIVPGESLAVQIQEQRLVLYVRIIVKDF
jgi:hypothetical protein